MNMTPEKTERLAPNYHGQWKKLRWYERAAVWRDLALLSGFVLVVATLVVIAIAYAN